MTKEKSVKQYRKNKSTFKSKRLRGGNMKRRRRRSSIKLKGKKVRTKKKKS